jgi:hypothetical protein
MDELRLGRSFKWSNRGWTQRQGTDFGDTSTRLKQQACVITIPEIVDK